MRKKAVLAATLCVLAAGASPGWAQGLHQNHTGMHGTGMHGTGALPHLPGQDIFGAVTEIVGILNADPATDWARVDIDALRAHLLDMHLVATEAEPEAETVAGGMRFSLPASTRAGAAAERMLAAHGPILEAEFGWTARLERDAGGIVWTVTAPNADETKLRALGFFGLLAAGGHHQAHHLAMARGAGHPHGPAE